MSDATTKERTENVVVENDNTEKSEVLPNYEVLQVATEIIDENIEALRALAK